MDDKTRRETEMCHRGYLFLNENKGDFISIPAIAAAITVLQTELQKISDLGADKVSVTGESKDITIHKGNLRLALQRAMQDISDMWKPMAKNYDNAENKFKMPNGSDQLLIDTAGSFIEDAEPIKAAFIARGMDEDFIVDLTAKRDNFETVDDTSQTTRLQKVGVNAQFAEPLKKCRDEIRNVDPIVKLFYRENPGKLAEWTSATHVERAPKRSNNGNTDETPENEN